MTKKNDIARKRSRERRWHLISTVIVAIVAVFALVLVLFKLLGFEIFTVMSGSMEPNYHVGSLIYVEKVNTDELQKGDVITFMMDENTVVTHRIDEIINEEDSSGASVRKFRTKGDANDNVDGKLTDYRNVLGSPVLSIPLLGYIAFYIQRPPGLYIAIVVCTLLIVYVFSPMSSSKKDHPARKIKEEPSSGSVEKKQKEGRKERE